MPPHDNLQHGAQEPAVAPRLVLGAAGDGVRDVAEGSVEADEGGEIRRLQHVNDGDESRRERRVAKRGDQCKNIFVI